MFFFLFRLETRRQELIEMRFGGLSEGWSLCMVHFIPVITVCTTTMAALLTLRFVDPTDVRMTSGYSTITFIIGFPRTKCKQSERY